MKEQQRIVIVAGPRCGKSTLAKRLHDETGAPVYCGDPLSKCKEPNAWSTYLPECLDWSEGSKYVADFWLTMNGPWIAEGQIMARALRKWASEREWHHMPCDRIIVLTEHHPDATVSSGQAAMHAGVMTVWREIRERFTPITQYR